MREEHRFCAEVYHRLHGLIDHSRRVLFCLDGSAAKEAAKAGEVECATMPDLCFCFSGSTTEMRIEAKIIEKRRVKLGIDQRNAWRHGGTGLAMPHIWIASNTTMSLFWMWSHETFCTKIAQHQNSTGPILVFQKDCEQDNFTIDELVERIVAWATEQGLKPKGTDSE